MPCREVLRSPRACPLLVWGVGAVGGWRRGARGQRVKQVGMRGRRDAGWGAEASPWTPQGLSSLAVYVAAPWGACGSPCMSRRAVLFRSCCTSRSCLFDPPSGPRYFRMLTDTCPERRAVLSAPMLLWARSLTGLSPERLTQRLTPDREWQ